ncbi:MAG: hypothetical protein COV67_05485 [Nitrospinae bacterium CG11_big_fil_rev_8_21_14_0_20_56_8]|nr:MAG: hypothetical protein COV67_05485 [Nitrospinae bacterium CG11_big_fil_rev_8_21_14_0_20_56_8]
MKKWIPLLCVPAFLLGTAFHSWAHVTPNVKLHTTREAVARLLPEGKLSLKEVTLEGENLKALESHENWDSQEDHFNFYVSRDGDRKLKRAAIFMTEFTRHGPVVVGVALDPEGKIADAVVTDVQAEPLEWIGPLLRIPFLESFRGKGSGLDLRLDEKWKRGTTEMAQAYGVILANALKKSAQLFELVFRNGK